MQSFDDSIPRAEQPCQDKRPAWDALMDAARGAGVSEPQMHVSLVECMRLVQERLDIGQPANDATTAVMSLLARQVEEILRATEHAHDADNGYHDLASIYPGIPAELRALKQWIVFKLVPKNDGTGKMDKIPYNARNGEAASSTNALTWSTFRDAVLAYVMKPGYDGIGLVFSENDPYAGVDLDACRDAETGEIAAWAQELIHALAGFCEVSPSGTGVHVIVRGRVPPRHKHTYQGGKVEMYDHGRFFTVTGNTLTGSASALTDDKTAVLSLVHAKVFTDEHESGSGAESDARGTYPPAKCGRTGLTDEQVLEHCRTDATGEEFIAYYDQGDLSNVDDDDSRADWFTINKLAFYLGDDIERIGKLFLLGEHFTHTQDGAKRAERKEKLLAPRPGYSTLLRATIAKALSGRPPIRVFLSPEPGTSGAGGKEDSTARPWPEPMAEAAYYGVLGEIARGIEPYIEADSAALLVNLIVTSGIAIERERFLQVGAQQHHGNLYAANVGDTGENKSDAKAPISIMLAEVAKLPPAPHPVPGGIDLTALLVPNTFSGLSSGEGFLWQIRDASEATYTDKESGREVPVDPGVEDKRLLVVESEFARILAVMQREGNILSTVLRDLLDSPAVARSSPKNNPIIVTEPHVGLIGQITPDELRRKLQEGELHNGFVNRFLWVLTRRVKSLPHPPDYRPKAKEHAQLWADAVKKARGIGEIRRDEAAHAQWEQEYERLRRGRGEERQGLARDASARAHVVVMRVSLIFAALDGSAEITRAHQTAALAVWEYCERCVAWLFGDMTGSPVADTILKALEKRGRMTRDEIGALFSRHDLARVQTALASLVGSGRVRSGKESTGGRPKEWFEVATGGEG